MAAKTQQLAVEQSLNYIQALRAALTDQDVDALNRLLYATEEATQSTWDLVYAQLELLELDDSQYEAALTRINTLRSLADTAVQSIGQPLDTLKDAREAQQKAAEEAEKERQKAAEQAEKDRQKAAEQAAKDAEDAAEAKAKAELEAAKKLNKTLTETLEDRQDNLSDLLKYVMEMIKSEIEQQIEGLEKQVEQYENIVNLQKDSLRLAKEKEEYDDSVSDQIKDMSELQSRINQLSLDDSREAQVEKMKLEEELAELQENLADEQAEYTYDTTVESLDKMAEKYAAEKDKEIAVLEESMSSTEKIYQMAIKRINLHWDTLYQDLMDWNYNYGDTVSSDIQAAWDVASAAVQRYGSYLEAVLQTQNELALLARELESLNETSYFSNSSSSYDSSDYGSRYVPDYSSSYDYGSGYSSSSGSSSSGSSGLLGSYNDYDYGSSSSGSSNVVGNTGYYDTTGAQSLSEIKEFVAEMKANTAAMKRATEQEKLRLNLRNMTISTRVQTRLGQPVVQGSDGTWYIDRVGGTKLYDKYHQGGIVGGNSDIKDNEVFALLENGEAVLTEAQKNAVWDAVDVTTHMMEQLGGALDSFEYAPRPKSEVFNVADGIIGANKTISEFINSGGNGSVTIEKLEAPVLVTQKLSKEDIKEHSKTIAQIAYDAIKETFAKKGIIGTIGRALKPN